MEAKLSFEWSEEKDGDRFWFWDEMHGPVPSSPLTITAHAPLISQGTYQAAAELVMPFKGMDLRFFHGYLYGGPQPLELSPSAFSDRLRAHSEQMDKAVLDLVETWDARWCPELQSYHTIQKAIQLQELDWRELEAYRLRTLDMERRRWTIHFLFWYIFGRVLDEFLQRFQGLVGSSDEERAYVLLQGFSNLTTETDQEIWRLAALVKSSAALREAFEETSPHQLLGRIKTNSRAGSFLGELERFLDTFGYRTASFPDLSDVTWLEDPAPVFIAIKHCLQGSFLDPHHRQERLARERDQAMKQLEPALGRDDRCMRLLSVLQKMWPITESHQFYLDQLSFVHSRFLYLEYGRRFAEAGGLVSSEDVFFLTGEELLETARGQGSGNLNSVVLERRKLLEEWKRFQPPRFLGKPPPEGGEARDPQLERVFGITRGPQMERRAAEVIGLAGAPGQVKGPVRILESAQQGELLKPGDILVTRTTTPAWTSLFRTHRRARHAIRRSPLPWRRRCQRIRNSGCRRGAPRHGYAQGWRPRSCGWQPREGGPAQ